MASPPHKSFFVLFSERAAVAAGHPAAFLCALSIVVLWGVSGPVFGFNDTWQLVINTGTTIITFLMVFIIQNAQNRDSKALQLKLDELIRATEGAHTVMLDIEELSERELKTIQNKYEEIAKNGRKRLRQGKTDTGSPDLTID